MFIKEALLLRQSLSLSDSMASPEEAIDIAREIACNQESELVIHRPNGQIRDKDSYRNDPFLLI